MRKTKFRGKKIDTGEWIYGSLLVINDQYYIHSNPHGDLDDIDFGWAFHQVTEESIGEFTGMVDKFDREIYEKDLLKTYENYTTFVKYNCCGFMIEHIGEDVYDELLGWFSFKRGYKSKKEDFEIIGNLIDNPINK